ncbi:MAG: hypothetical protein NVSMB19_19850 [Vulcanimicrobiaceae bacterium]
MMVPDSVGRAVPEASGVFDGNPTLVGRSRASLNPMNVACTHCFGRWYSAAAKTLVGQPCTTAGCSGTLVQHIGRTYYAPDDDSAEVRETAAEREPTPDAACGRSSS